MNSYRPSTSDPVVVTGGVWRATGKPDRTVTLSFDPRLLEWFVNQAARRPSLTYEVANGKPPAKVQLT